MNEQKLSALNHFSTKIIGPKEKTYREYIFLKDADDIVNKIYHSTFFFIKFSNFSSEKKLYDLLNALCHKVNMVKYHLLRYEKIERELLKTHEENIKGVKKEGAFLIEHCELTAEYEGFLLQLKATFDILVGFLNPLYSRNNKNPLKKQVTFGNTGLDVIKNLKKYITSHPEKKPYLEDLINHLKKECSKSTHFEDGSINWLSDIIKNRDVVAHHGKFGWFASKSQILTRKNPFSLPPLAPLKLF